MNQKAAGQFTTFYSNRNHEEYSQKLLTMHSMLKSTSRVDGYVTGAPSKRQPVKIITNSPAKEKRGKSVIDLRKYVSSKPSTRQESVRKINEDQKLSYLMNRASKMARTDILSQTSSGIAFKLKSSETPFNKRFTFNTETR